jgi:hypothetical protein
MIEKENMLEMLDCIGVMLEKGMRYSQFDYLMVYKPVNLVKIVVMWENIEVMVVNKLVKLVNRLVMHYFHHDHLENMLEMLDCRLEMLDCMKVLMDLMEIVENRLVMLDCR